MISNCNKRSQDFDERPHCRGGIFHRGCKCDTGQSGATQSAAAVALMPLLFFCCVHSIAVTHNAFQWAGQPQKLPIPLGDLDPTYYIVPWAHPIGIPRWRMAWRCLRDAMFNRFDRTPQLVRDRQTDIWPQHICASIASCGKNSSQNTNSENVLTVMSILQRYPYSLGLASHNSIHKRPRMHG